MKSFARFFSAIATVLFFGGSFNTQAQFTFVSDRADNYGGTWNNGSDQGTGLGAWGLSAGTSTGSFIGNPANNGMGTTGIGTTAFGIWSTGNNGYFNASRGFDSAMQIGDTFTFYWAMNWDAGSGSKGFDLKAGGTTIFNVNNTGSATITTTAGTAFTDYGTTPMLVTLTRSSGTQYSFSMTARNGGSTYSTTINSSSAVDNFNFYSGNQNNGAGERNMFFDEFSVTNTGIYSTTLTESRALTGTGRLVVSNNSTLTLTADGNTFSGGTSIQSGSTLSVGNGGGVGNIGGVITNNGALTFNRNANTLSLSGVISGSGTVTKSGAGGQINLSGDNSYSGATTVSGGSLELQHANALGSTAAGTTVNSGAELRLWNSSGLTYAAEGLTLSGVGISNGGALRNIINNNVWQGNITMGSGTRINSDSGTLTISGTVAGGANNMYFGGSGNITLSNTVSGTATTGDGAIFKDGSGTLTLSANNSALTGLVRIRGGTISITNANSLGTGSIELGNGATTATLLVNSNTTIANRIEVASEGSAGVINVASGTTNIISGILSQTNGTANTTKFGKAGAGTLILNNAGGTYNGQIQIGQGTLILGATAALGTNTSTANRGIDLGLNVGDTSTTDNVSLLASNNVTVGQSIFVASASESAVRTIGISGSGTATFTNEIYLAGDLTVDAGASATDQVTISGVITNTGGLTKTGAGILLLSGNNSYTGATTIGAGTLRIGANDRISSQSAITISNGATLDMNTFTDTLGAISGAGTIAIGTGTLTTTVGADTVFSGAITGSGSFTKNGNSVLTLSGISSSYTGAITVSVGALRVSNASALGTTAGGVTVSAQGAALELSGGISVGAEALSLNSDGISAGGALRNISGNNSWAGTITLGSGTRINSATANDTLTLSGGVTGGSNVLYVGGSGNTTISTSGLTGAGATQDGTVTSIYKDGSGTLTLTSANTFTGDTRISAGKITVGSGGSLGSGSDVFLASAGTLEVNANTAVASVQEWAGSNSGVIAIGTGATLTIDGANKGTLYQNSISGLGGLTMAGSGTTSLSLFGTQSYSGLTSVSGGKISTGVVLSNSSGVAVSGGTFETSAVNILKDTATVTISGTGTYSLGGNDTVASLTMTGGTLSGAGTMTATSAFDIQAGTISAGLGGSVGLNKTGSGTATLSGSSSYSGKTTISAGILEVTSSNALGNGGAGNGVDIASGARLRATANMTNARAITITSGTGYVEASSGTTNTLNGTLTKNGTTLVLGGAGTHIVNGSIVGANANSDLYVSNSTTTINSTNSYNGPTFIVAGGTLINGTNNALPTDTALTLGQSDDSASVTNTYNLSGKEQRVASIAATGTAAANIITNSTGTANLTLSNTVNTSFSNLKMGGSGLTLTKSGANTVTLTSGNTIGPGTIAIQQGTLLLGAANQIGDSTAITLSGGKLSTAGYADEVGKLTVSANSTIQGLNDTSGAAFTFSNIDLSTYSGSGGSTLTFLNSSGGNYSLGTVFQISTVAANLWTGWSTTSQNNFEQKIQFGNGNVGQLNFGSGISGTTLTVAAIPDARVYTAAAFLLVLIGATEYRRRRRPCGR